MYQVEATATILRARAARCSQAAERAPRIARNIVLLGLTSLLTDVSTEMVTTVLPLYVFFGLGATPLVYGVVDGIQQGAAVLVRLVSGYLADRTRRHKGIAAVGYGLGALSKAGLLVFSGVTGLAAMVLADRTGKGIRTAPRDALISLSVPPAALGRAFGVHRAMDTAGAVLGPMLDAPLRAAAGLLRDARVRRLIGAGALLGLFTISDAFLYLGLQKRIDFDVALFPLLFVGTAVAYTVLSVPIGRLADRVGRRRVFVAGNVLLLPVYSSLLLTHIAPVALVGYLLLFGAWYACSDGVLMALASGLLPDDLRASGLGALASAQSVAKLAASVAFGALWTLWGLHGAVLVFGSGLALALAATVVLLRVRG